MLAAADSSDTKTRCFAGRVWWQFQRSGIESTLKFAGPAYLNRVRLNQPIGRESRPLRQEPWLAAC